MKIFRVAAPFILSAFIFLLSGCDAKININQRPDPSEYVCNEEQLNLVAKETNICAQTGYMSDFCFAVAKATHCKKIKKENSR